jgi:hypothetical protein
LSASAISAQVFRERQLDEHDGADAFLAFELKGDGFLVSTTEISAFLFTVERLILAIVYYKLVILIVYQLVAEIMM